MTEGGAVKQKIFTYDYMHNTSYFSVEDDHKQEELVYHSTVRWLSRNFSVVSGLNSAEVLQYFHVSVTLCVNRLPEVQMKDDGLYECHVGIIEKTSRNKVILDSGSIILTVIGTDFLIGNAM